MRSQCAGTIVYWLCHRATAQQCGNNGTPVSIFPSHCFRIATVHCILSVYMCILWFTWFKDIPPNADTHWAFVWTAAFHCIFLNSVGFLCVCFHGSSTAWENIWPLRVKKTKKKTKHRPDRINSLPLGWVHCCFWSIYEMQGFHLTTGLLLFLQVQYNMRNSHKQRSTNRTTACRLFGANTPKDLPVMPWPSVMWFICLSVCEYVCELFFTRLYPPPPFPLRYLCICEQHCALSRGRLILDYFAWYQYR